MAKPQLILHFHAEEPSSPLAEAARRMAGLEPSAARPSAGGPGKTLAALQKLSNRLGAPVLLSMSSERLVRALSDPAERKALSNGVTRGRFLPTPFPAFSTAPGLLSPLEVSDELRLNIDIWTMGLITPPFAHADRFPRLDVRGCDPTARLSELPTSGQTVVLGVDLTALEAAGDSPGTIARLAVALGDYKARDIGKPQIVSRNDVNFMLSRILTQGDRFRGFGSADTAEKADYTPGYTPILHGFPFDLASRACPIQVASRSLATSASALVQALFDPAGVDTKIGRGILLRGLARARGPATPSLDQAIDSFSIALALLGSARDDIASDAKADATSVAAAAAIPAALERWLEKHGAQVSAECLAEAKKRKTRAVRATPKAGAELTQAAFFTEVEKATRAGFDCLTLLAAGSVAGTAEPAKQVETAKTTSATDRTGATAGQAVTGQT